MTTQYEIGKLCGCYFNQREAEKFQSTLPTHNARMLTHLRGVGAGANSMLWELYEKEGVPLPANHAQGIGDCVSHGEEGANEDTIIAAQAGGQEVEWKGELATEAKYGLSRCEVAKWWNSYEDGSTGTYGVMASRDWGSLLRKKYANIDLSTYSADLAKKWGAKGLPDDLEPEAKLHVIKGFTLVTSFEQMQDMLANGSGVNVASNRGFRMKYDGRGCFLPSGSWSHQMRFRGCLILKGNQPIGVCQNSWANVPEMNQQPTFELEDGRTIKGPKGSFGVYPDTVNEMLRAKESYARSASQGFERIQLKWIA